MKPMLWEAARAHARGVVAYAADGTAMVQHAGEQIRVPTDHQYDLTQATLFGLNERLTLAATSPRLENGQTLRDAFNDEWRAYQKNPKDYGWYAYYDDLHDLVRYAPPFWHHVVAVASNSKLYADPDGALSWREIRTLFEQTTIAVAGCSVGSSVAHAAVMDMRPARIKLADKSLYKMENINRVRLGYSDIVKSNAEHQAGLPLRRKAETTARQLYAIDPFLDIAVYADGVDDGNVSMFLSGMDNEPRADVLVEEVDDPKTKMLLREEARKRGIPVVMVTDAGSAVQLDVLRYDLDQSLPLAVGVKDDVLRRAADAVYDDPGNRKAFFGFVDALIGRSYRQGELKDILLGKTEIPTSTIIPQLGSTAAMAGAIGAEAVARIRLGWTLPPRAFFDKHTFRVKRWRSRR